MPQSAAEIMARPEADLIATLKDPAAEYFLKAKACQRLAVVGTRAAIPALAALLTDAKLSHYARFGLEPMPDPAAAKALRKAVGKTTGNVKAGLLNSLAARADRKRGYFKKYLQDSDPQVAKAAAFGIAKCGGPRAAKVLADAWKNAAPEFRTVLSHAALLCAATLPGDDDAKLNDLLKGNEAPAAVRTAAG